MLPQESLLLGGIWFAYCKHEADCKNRHLLLLSQAMKVHVDTLGIVCNYCISELRPQHTIMGLGEEGAFLLVSFLIGNWKHTLTHIKKKVKTSGQVGHCGGDIGPNPVSFVIYYPFTKAHSAE